jgi:hypothetical protein
MRKKCLYSSSFIAVCVLAGACLGQPRPAGSVSVEALCSLQKRATEGSHEVSRVSGVFSGGFDIGTLEDAACPSEDTWVELALVSTQNKDKLHRILERSRRAYVLVEGEFYGPPLPDPKLPEAIRKTYHPGWGHLAAFKTKLVIHSILEVKAASKVPSK